MHRSFAASLSSHDLAFTFEVHGLPDVCMTAEVRRDVFLAFKETLHNVVRHARCETVAIDVRLEGGRVGFTVRDDGRGFDVSDTEGHGLSSVRRRADRLGGTLAITSKPGGGTTVDLFVPLEPPRAPRLRAPNPT